MLKRIIWKLNLVVCKAVGAGRGGAGRGQGWGGGILLNLIVEGCIRSSQQQLVIWEASQNLLGTQKENRGNVYECGRFQDLSGCLLTSSKEPYVYWTVHHLDS